MDREKLAEIYKKYNLESSDVFKHKHYLILTRNGIEKIQAKEGIEINYNVVSCNPEYCAVKAIGKLGDLEIQTFGSAKYGGKLFNEKTKKWVSLGNTDSWYVLEIAEKRAMSRVVLKLTGLYENDVYGEDESDEFKEKRINYVQEINKLLKTANIGADEYCNIERIINKKETKSYSKALQFLKYKQNVG